jgi:hypothetical protein
MISNLIQPNQHVFTTKWWEKKPARPPRGFKVMGWEWLNQQENDGQKKNLEHSD